MSESYPYPQSAERMRSGFGFSRMLPQPSHGLATILHRRQSVLNITQQLHPNCQQESIYLQNWGVHQSSSNHLVETSPRHTVSGRLCRLAAVVLVSPASPTLTRQMICHESSGPTRGLWWVSAFRDSTILMPSDGPCQHIAKLVLLILKT
jgi:hypothetical protein